MNPQINRWARLALASCAAAVVIGCDNSESALLDQQANALAVRSSGGSGTEVSEKITGAAEGSLPVNVQSIELVAQARLSDARGLADSLAVKQAQTDALVSRISSLASVAGTTAMVTATQNGLDPSKTIAHIQDLTAKTRGDGNAAAVTDVPGTSIPTLNAVKQEKSRLEGELATAQGQLQEATAKRNDLLTQVGNLSAQSDQQRGEDKLKTVTQAADLRQQAAVVSRTISDLESAINRLTADLGVQTQLETQLDAAVKSFDTQQSALAGNWKETKAKVDLQTAFAKSVLSADGGDKGEVSVKTLINELVEALKQAGETREQAVTAFEDAVTKFSDAKAKADSFGSSVSSAESGGRNAPEKAAWSALTATLNGDRINLQKAIAKREEAGIYRAHAQSLLHMASVAESLEQISEGLAAVPEPFNSQKLIKEAGDAVTKADELLGEAKDMIEGITGAGGDTTSIKSLQSTTKIFINYDRALLSQLASSASLAGDIAKEQTYTDSIEGAKAAIREAREGSLAVPNVPAAIYVEPPKVVEEKPAEATTATTDSPTVLEVKQSLKDLVTQLAATPDDPSIIEQLFNRIKTDETSQPLVAPVRELAELGVRINKAVKEKFGDEGVAAIKELGVAAVPNGQAMDPEAAKKKIDELKMTSSDDTHAALALPLPGDEQPTLKFLKEDDIWKLDLTGLPQGFTAMGGMMVGAMGPMKDKLTSLATDIENGTIDTIEKLKERMAALKPGAPAETAPAAPPAEPPASGNTQGTGALPDDIGTPAAPPQTPPSEPTKP